MASSSSQLSRSSTASGDLDALLLDPPDLLCPISCSIYTDPVLTAAGQVYERSAIMQHLQQSNTDPLSRQNLASKSLTPVHMLRSKAMEYRETTARACVEIACSSNCPQPVRFVRRACELAGEDIRVKGLTPTCIAYTMNHGNAFDTQVMMAFAQSLYDGGYRDKAAGVYQSLLLSGGLDRAQQAELLKLVLRCWALEGPPTGPQGGSSVGILDANMVDKLAQYVEGQPSPSWGHIMDVCHDAGLGRQFVLSLCEQLLLRYSSASQAVATSIANDMRWNMERELLLRYVQLTCTGVLHEQAALGKQLADLAVWRQLVQEEAAEKQMEASKKGPLHKVPQHRLLGCVTATVSAVMGGWHPLGRLLGVGAGLLLTMKGENL